MARKGGRARGRRSGPSRELVKAARPGGLGAAQLSPSGARQTSAQTTSLVDAVQGMTRAALNSATPNAYAPVENLPRDPLDNGPFGPLWPLMVQAINPPRTDTGRPEPRVWEYPTGFNLPGSGDRLIPWATLRAASVNVDIIRRCIEIRKDDVRALKWAWRISEDAVKAAQEADPATPRDEIEAGLRKKYAADIARLTKMWQRPWITNGVRFGQWVAAVMDDHITLDGVAVYPVTTVGGQVIGFRVIDATTIKLLINDLGERPQPPYPAFQQKLEGFPRGEYLADVVLNEDCTENVDNGFTASQITYWRENFRTYTPYGFSQVEQALVSAALYLKRQGWMHAEYDEGSTPLTWLVPQGDKFTANQLSPMQRREYETAINDDLEGQTGKRHRIKVSYPGFVPTQMDSVDEQYKPDYDLFLLKLVASHLGVTLDRLGFTEAKGLGASGQHERQAQVQDDSGVNPDAAMLTDLIMELSRNYLDCPEELIFEFFQKKTEDEAAKDAIWAARRQRGAASMNEDRKANGLTPWDTPEADMPSMVTATGIVYIEGGAEQQAAMQELAKNPPAPAGPGGPPGSGRPGSGAGGSGPKPTGPKPAPRPGGGPAPKNKAAAADELAGYRRWLRKQAGRIPVRPFRFEHAEPADLAGHELDGRFQEFDGYEWRQDITKDWRSWNTEHPLHPRGPHGRFVKIGNLVDELKRAHGPLSEHHENALDEAVRRTHVGKPVRRGESSLTDDLVHRGLLEEMPDRKDHFQVSEAGRRHLVARTPEDYGHEPVSAPEPVQPKDALTSAIASGVVSERPLSGGKSSDVQLITFGDGTQAVKKKITEDADNWSPKNQADAEELAGYVAEAVGVRAPKAKRISKDSLYLEYIPGRAAREAHGRDVPKDILDSDQGVRLGLLDHITNNTDRHAGNWVVGDDGIAAIDNGLMFNYSTTIGHNPFGKAHFDEDTPNALTSEDVAAVRSRLELLKPKFEQMGRGDWYRKMMKRLDEVGRNASGPKAPPAETAIQRGRRQARAAVAASGVEYAAHAEAGMDVIRERGRSSPELAALLESTGTPDEAVQAARGFAQGQGLTPVGGAGEGALFDPRHHEALPGLSHKPGEPVMVAAPGYTTGEAVVRRATVVGAPSEPVQAPTVEDAVGQGAADRLRQAEIMYGSDRSQWPARAKRDAQRLERQAAREQRSVSAAEPSVGGGQVIDSSGTVEGMTTLDEPTITFIPGRYREPVTLSRGTAKGDLIAAYRRESEASSALVPLARLRNAPEMKGHSRADFDEAVRELHGDEHAVVAAEENPQRISQQAESDAVRIGGTDRHLLSIGRLRSERGDKPSTVIAGNETFTAFPAAELARIQDEIDFDDESGGTMTGHERNLLEERRDALRREIDQSQNSDVLKPGWSNAAHAALSAFGVEQSNRLEELRRIPRGAPDRAALLAERTALQRTRQAALDATAELSRRHGSPVDRILRNLSDTMDEIERENVTGLTKAAGPGDGGKA